MKISRAIAFAILALAPILSQAGYKPLAVAFFDFTKGSSGKLAFKKLRVSGYEHPCWSESFVEISGIQTVYIEKIPQSLNRELLLKAVRGDAMAAEQFRLSLEKADLNGAYAFAPDPSGFFAVIHSIGYQRVAVTSSVSVPLPEAGKNIDTKLFSKRLCEASKAMD